MMDDKKVLELREKIKNARQSKSSRFNTEPGNDAHGTLSTSDTSATAERYVPEFPTENGSGVQLASGQDQRTSSPSESTDRVTRRNDDQPGSTSQINIGVRQSARRLGGDNGQSGSDGADISAGVTSRKRRVGNLETTDIIPKRHFKEEVEIKRDSTIGTGQDTSGVEEPRKRGRPSEPKDVTAGSKRKGKSLFNIPKLTPIKEDDEKERSSPASKPQSKILTGGTKTLSKQEVDVLEEPLTAAIQREFETLDRLLLGMTKDVNPLEQPIWGDMSDDSVSVLARGLLNSGQSSPTAATIARTMINMDSYIMTGLLIAPRFQKSVMLIQQQQAYNKQKKVSIA